MDLDGHRAEEPHALAAAGREQPKHTQGSSMDVDEGGRRRAGQVLEAAGLLRYVARADVDVDVDVSLELLDAGAVRLYDSEVPIARAGDYAQAEHLRTLGTC